MTKPVPSISGTSPEATKRASASLAERPSTSGAPGLASAGQGLALPGEVESDKRPSLLLTATLDGVTASTPLTVTAVDLETGELTLFGAGGRDDVPLAEALYAAGNICTDAASNYDDGASIETGDMLVSYTSQVPVSDEACAAREHRARPRARPADRRRVLPVAPSRTTRGDASRRA